VIVSVTSDLGQRLAGYRTQAIRKDFWLAVSPLPM
jgi:hypothetical protein